MNVDVFGGALTSWMASLVVRGKAKASLHESKDSVRSDRPRTRVDLGHEATTVCSESECDDLMALSAVRFDQMVPPSRDAVHHLSGRPSARGLRENTLGLISPSLRNLSM